MADGKNTSFLSTNESLSSTINSSSQTLNWPVLGLTVLAVFGTFGNLLVCASISLDKQLQTVTNWFLFSLAIADCLVSLIVLPLAIIKDFQGRQTGKASDGVSSVRDELLDGLSDKRECLGHPKIALPTSVEQRLSFHFKATSQIVDSNSCASDLTNYSDTLDCF